MTCMKCGINHFFCNYNDCIDFGSGCWKAATAEIKKMAKTKKYKLEYFKERPLCYEKTK